MKTQTLHRIPTGLLLLGMIATLLFALVFPQLAHASVLPATTCTESAGVRTCDLWATTGTLTLPVGSVPASVTIWGYAADGISPAGLPGPTLIAIEGETLEINLTNNLSEATSISIRGLSGPSDTVGAAGGGGTKTYAFTGLEPGTYLYEAGPTANGERQVAMGLYGVLIVRPLGAPQEAYGPASAFDDEAVLVMSEIDPALNASPAGFDLRNFAPKYFLFNGKAYPDTAAIDTDAGRKVLLRLVNAGLENHSAGVLGLRYTVLSIDAKPFASPHSAVAETLSAGQTADVLVSIPAAAPAGMKYALYDSSLRLINNGSSFGGMLTFLSIPAAPSGPDVTGPSASGLSLAPNPSDGSGLVTFDATVSDASSGGSNVVAVEYFVGSTGANGAGTAMTASDAAFDSPTEAATASIDPTSLPHGNYSIYVHGQDSTGNWGAFNFIVMKLDKEGPTTSALQTTFQGTGDVVLSGSASDVASGNSNIQAAEYFIDATGADGTGQAMALNQSAPTAAITATISAATMTTLSEGAHTVYVHSQDAFGNWGTFATKTLNVDLTGPAPSLVQLRPNPNNGTLAYAPTIQSVRLDATFSEPGGGPVTSAVVNAEFFIDTVDANGTGVLMTPSDGLFNGVTEAAYTYIPLITVSAMSEGSHTLYIHGKDAAGNWGPFATIDLIIDKTAPAVLSINRVGSNPTTGPSVQFLVTFSESVTGVSASNFAIVRTGLTGTSTITSVAGSGTTRTVTVTTGTGSGTIGLNLTSATNIKDVAGNSLPSTGLPFVGQTFTIAAAPQPSLYFSTFGNTNPPGVGGTADNADIYFYNGTAFSRIADVTGAPYGLPAGANVDGLDRVDATHFYMSFAGGVTVPGIAGTVADEDVVYYNAGTWSLYFDGSANGIGGTDVDAINISGGSLYLSTDDNDIPPGAGGPGDDGDIYVWNGPSSFTRVFDASASGFAAGADVDGFVRVDATHFYLSFRDDASVPGIGTVQDEDVVYNNAGVWSVYFNGTALGLTSGNLDLDAFDLP